MLVLKDVLRPRLKPISSGGKEFQPDKYVTDSNKFYPSHICIFIVNSICQCLAIFFLVLQWDR